MTLGSAGMHNQVKLWTESKALAGLLDTLLDRGFAVFLTSDHGNVEAGVAAPGEKSLAELRGQRARVYRDRGLRSRVATRFRMRLHGRRSDCPRITLRCWPRRAGHSFASRSVRWPMAESPWRRSSYPSSRSSESDVRYDAPHHRVRPESPLALARRHGRVDHAGTLRPGGSRTARTTARRTVAGEGPSQRAGQDDDRAAARLDGRARRRRAASRRGARAVARPNRTRPASRCTGACVWRPTRFFRDVAATTGRLLALQGEAALSQIVRRMAESWGERSTVTRAVQRVVRSFVEWGVLAESGDRGVFSPAAKVVVSGDRVGPWLVEAAW